MPSLGFNPGLFFQGDRLNQQQGMGTYDPNQYVDPMTAIAMQQNQLRQLFAMQNPRLALPQNFGAALGQAIGGMINPNQNNAQGQQQQTSPQTPTGQAIHALYQKNLQNGMYAGKALAMAADQIEANPNGLDDQDPKYEAVLDHARQYATEKLKYNPQEDAKMAQERQLAGSENLIGPDGNITAVSRGDPNYQKMLASGDYRKASDVPQLTPGSLHTFLINGKYYTYQVDANGNLDTSGKPVGVSTTPLQVSATLTGDAAGAAATAAGTVKPNVLTNSAFDETVKGLTNRSIATKNTIDSIDLLDKTAQGIGIGKPSDIAEHIRDARATIETLASATGLSSNPSDYKMAWSPQMASQLDKWKAAGINAEQVKSLFLQTALLDEATNGDKNESDANRKFSVEQHMRILGEDSSDLQALHSTLMQHRTQLVTQLNNEFDGKPNVMPKPQWLQQESAKLKQPSGPPTRPGQGSSGAVEGARSTSKSGKPMIFTNGHWQYQ